MIAAAVVVAAQVAAAMPVTRAADFDPLAPDQAAHLAVSYSLTLTGALLLEKLEWERWPAVAVAGVATFALGAFKEWVLDDAASGADLLADGIGVGLAAGVVYAFEL